MTQVKRCRYGKLLAVGALLTATLMFTGFNGMTKAEVNLTDGQVHDKTAGSEYFLRKASPKIGTTPSKKKLAVWMSNDNATVSTTTGYRRSVGKDQFVLLDGTENIQGGDVVKVPSEYQFDFHVEIKGMNKDGLIKLFRDANVESEVIQSFKIPNKIILKDMNLYNGRFFKIKDADGKDWYVDSTNVDYKVIPHKNLRMTGETITDKVRNVQLNLTERTNLTAEEIKVITLGTGLEGIEDAVVEIEEAYDINAIFTLALAAHESGWGTSYLARDRNNLFGICAYDSNVGAASGYSSKAECVRSWGSIIYNEYFAHGRTTLSSINDIYASDTTWASQVASTMRRIANRI